QHRLSNRERHLLSGPDDLRAADDQAAPVHLCQNFADSGVDFFELDYVRLKSAMECSVNRVEDEGDEVWVFLKSVVETLVVARVVQSLNAAGDFESAGKAGDDVAVALAVELDLAGFVLHELRLVAAFDGTQLSGAPAGKQVAGERERQQADQEEDSQDYVEETDSSKFFEHSWFWRYNRRQVLGVTERRCSASGYYCRAPTRVSTCFNTPLRLCVLCALREVFS